MKTIVSVFSLLTLIVSSFAMAEVTPPPPGERHVVQLDSAQSQVVELAIRTGKYAETSQVTISDSGNTCTANQYKLSQGSSRFLGNDYISCTDRSDCHSVLLTPSCQIYTLESPGTNLSDVMNLQ